jgi:hypothetical protein
MGLRSRGLVVVQTSTLPDAPQGLAAGTAERLPGGRGCGTGALQIRLAGWCSPSLLWSMWCQTKPTLLRTACYRCHTPHKAQTGQDSQAAATQICSTPKPHPLIFACLCLSLTQPIFVNFPTSRYTRRLSRSDLWSSSSIRSPLILISSVRRGGYLRTGRVWSGQRARQDWATRIPPSGQDSGRDKTGPRGSLRLVRTAGATRLGHADPSTREIHPATRSFAHTTLRSPVFACARACVRIAPPSQHLPCHRHMVWTCLCFCINAAAVTNGYDTVTNGYDYYGALHLQAQAVPRIG